MTQFRTTIYRSIPHSEAEDEIPVTVTYNYTAGLPGARERGTGLRLSPDDEPELEVEAVMDFAGHAVELTEAELAAVESEAWEHLERTADR